MELLSILIYLHCLVIINCLYTTVPCALHLFLLLRMLSRIRKLFVCNFSAEFHGRRVSALARKKQIVAWQKWNVFHSWFFLVLEIVRIIHVSCSLFLWHSTHTHTRTRRECSVCQLKAITKNKFKMWRQNSTRSKSKFFSLCAVRQFFFTLAFYNVK